MLGTEEGWVAYQAGEQKAYDCGPCHTTGYKPEGYQDGLPGLIGTWEETGVTCEECHGPGSNHAKDPYGGALKVDRTSEACGDCHMPRIVKSAVGDAAQWSSDIRTHFFVIDVEADGQFNEDGSKAISQISLDWACKSCHGSEGYANDYSDAELYAEAKDYHSG